MGQIERYRHIVLCFSTSIAEHHALVAGTLVLLITIVNASVNISALFMNGIQNATRIAIKLIGSLRIADTLNGFARNGLQVDISFRAHFAHNHHLSGSYKRFNCTASLVVVSEKLVEQGIGNLIRHLIGMSF